MKANKIQLWMTALILSSVCFPATAQVPDKNLNREMTLEREYDPSVQDANKINRLPEVKEPEIVKRPIDYSPFTVPTEPKSEFSILPSGKIMTEIPYNKRKGYFHFGGGMFVNLNGDLGYHILDTEKDELCLFATHHSTNGNVKFPDEDNRKVKAKLNDNLIQMNYRHLFGATTRLHLGAAYGYTGFNYYGKANPIRTSSSSLSSHDLLDTVTNQANQTFRFDAGINGIAKERFVYLIDAKFHHFDQKYGWTKDVKGIRENHFTPRFDFAALFGDGQHQRAGLAGLIEYCRQQRPFNYPNDSAHTHIAATFTPYYRAEGDNWKLQLGANVMLVNADSLTVLASPNISVEANVFEKTVFYAKATGEARLNDASELSRQNRYIDLSPDFRPSRTWLDAVIGIRSSIASNCRIDIFGGYKITDDEIFFIPNYYISVVDFAAYSGGLQTDASRLHLGAALEYSYRKYADFSIRGKYNHWTVESDGRNYTTYAIGDEGMKPYGHPKIELNADLTVRPVAPLAVTLGYYMGAERYTLLVTNIEERMTDLHDLNLTAAWNFTDMFGAYLKLNNLLFRQQEVIYGYPLQGFNAMAGINLNF